MDLRLPGRLTLARLPTPLEPLARAGARLGTDLRVKRDDLTGLEITGNKARKLEFLLARAIEESATDVVTVGAVGSNHARATAAACARLGLVPHALLKGTPPPPRSAPDGNLLLMRLFGAHVEFVDDAGWARRDTRIAEMVERLRGEGRRLFSIPEGGSDALGALGYAVAAGEILEQANALSVDVRRIVLACGSGGTAAGLALGLAAAGRADVDVLAVAVTRDRAHFDARIAAILDQAVVEGYAPPSVRAAARWTVVEGHVGPGYARTTPEGAALLARVAREEGLLLDPVYTGKAWACLESEARAGRLAGRGSTLFLHTGGSFGLFPFRSELAAAL